MYSIHSTIFGLRIFYLKYSSVLHALTIYTAFLASKFKRNLALICWFSWFLCLMAYQPL